MRLTLITNRSALDASNLLALREKVKNRTATESERALWVSSQNGAYNYSDMNRVGNAIQYLAGLLNGYGYPVTVSPKTDWDTSGIPQQAQMAQYLSDLNAIKSALYGTKEVPSSMSNLTHEQANTIEALLEEIETNIYNMAASFVYSGEIYCGEVYP